MNRYKAQYAAARRYDKLAITDSIVKGIQEGRWGAPGRFLRRSVSAPTEKQDQDASESSYWVEATDSEAREKVSHALRGKTKKIKEPTETDSKKKAVPSGRRRRRETVSNQDRSGEALSTQAEESKTELVGQLRASQTPPPPAALQSRGDSESGSGGSSVAGAISTLLPGFQYSSVPSWPTLADELIIRARQQQRQHALLALSQSLSASSTGQEQQLRTLLGEPAMSAATRAQLLRHAAIQASGPFRAQSPTGGFPGGNPPSASSSSWPLPFLPPRSLNTSTLSGGFLSQPTDLSLGSNQSSNLLSLTTQGGAAPSVNQGQHQGDLARALAPLLTQSGLLLQQASQLLQQQQQEQHPSTLNNALIDALRTQLPGNVASVDGSLDVQDTQGNRGESDQPPMPRSLQELYDNAAAHEASLSGQETAGIEGSNSNPEEFDENSND